MVKAITEDFGNGGTIDGDLVITGDLQVSGGGSLSFDEIIEGTQVIDVTNTEALLVRKDGDGGDVFIVDTTNSRVGINKTPTQALDVSGNILASGASAPSITATDTTNTTSIQMRALDTEVRFGSVTNHPVKIGANSSTTGLVIDTSNNVGIGISPVASQKLHVNVASNVNFTTSANSSSLRLNAVNDVVDATIPLEINSTSTKFLSDVSVIKGTTSSTQNVMGIGKAGNIESSGGGSAFLTVHGNTNNQRGQIELGSDNLVGDGTIMGRVFFYNLDGGSSVVSRAQISAMRDGADDASKLVFATEPTGGNVTDNFVLDANSRISISNNDAGASNTIFGKSAGASLDTGSNYNTFIGENVSDASMDNAVSNVGVGWSALSDLTSGDQNTALGTQSLANLDTGSNNVAVGYNSGGSITSGGNNTIVGRLTADALTSGSSNVVIGDSALGTATTATLNVVIGGDSMSLVPASVAIQDVVAIGQNAFKGSASTTDGANGTVAIGRDSLKGLTSGTGNTAVGFESLKANQTGTHNTAFGNVALDACTGSSNTAIGFGALGSVVGGGTNIGIGSGAGNKGGGSGADLTTGNNNTLIGNVTRVSTSGADNQTVIGYDAIGQADNSVTLGNGDVTDVYMAQDSGAYVHSQNVPNHVANTMSSPYYRFDGVNDKITIADTDNFSFTDGSGNDSSFSISSWIYVTDATNWVIFQKGVNFASSEYGFYINANDQLTIHLLTDGSNYLGRKQTATIAENKWHHVVATYSGSESSSGLKLYLNGVQVDDADVNGGSYTGMANTSGVAQIGFRDSNYSNGQMACVQVHNHELDSTEVKELYSGASVPYKYKGANQTNVITGWTNNSYGVFTSSDANITDAHRTGGTQQASTGALSLTVGKRYRLTANITVDAGTGPTLHMGAANAAVGTDLTSQQTSAGINTYEFTLTNSSNNYLWVLDADVSEWSGTFELVPIGAVAEYDGSGITSDTWFDKSGNSVNVGDTSSLNGTVSGATVENAPSGDDGLVFETGTFTPTLTTNGTDFTSVTYDSLVSGRYSRVGNTVHVQGFMRTEAINKGSANGDVAIGNLPFSAVANTSGTANGQASISISNASGWTGENPSHGVIIQTTTLIQLYYADYNVDANNIAVSDVTDGTSADKNALYFAGTYTI